jgi:hypothetical protein
MMATGLLDYLEAIGETGATLGSGAAATMAGIPYGILQNIRSGKYGTKEGVKLADKATQDFIKQYTYAPRGQMAQNALQSVAGLLESTKLPPVLPEAGLLAAIPKGTYASQFERAGMAAERAMEPVAANVMARGGLPAQLLTDLTQGTRSQMLPEKSIKQMPQSKSLLDMNRTPSEAEIKKAPREDLINWLQNNDPNGAYLDPTPDPAVNMYRTAKGYAIEDANTGSVSEFGDYNKAKQEFDALRFSNSEFPPMTLKEAQESAINYLRESAQPAGGGKLLQFGSKPSGLLD